MPNAILQEAFKVPGIAFKFWPSLKCRLTNNHTVLRFEFYVVPAAAECGEGGSTRRSPSSKTTFRTGIVEEKCSERDRKTVGKREGGREKNKGLPSVAVCLPGFLGFPFCKVQLGNTTEAREQLYRV